jgi:hypothetical protein
MIISVRDSRITWLKLLRIGHIDFQRGDQYSTAAHSDSRANASLARCTARPVGHPHSLINGLDNRW